MRQLTPDRDAVICLHVRTATKTFSSLIRAHLAGSDETFLFQLLFHFLKLGRVKRVKLQAAYTQSPVSMCAGWWDCKAWPDVPSIQEHVIEPAAHLLYAKKFDVVARVIDYG